jgi:MerR family mercuric resistance operon transcriptional regulator
MVRDIGLGHLDDVRAKIAHLRQVERLLEKTISQCTGTTASECPVLDALDITRSEHPLNS